MSLLDLTLRGVRRNFRLYTIYLYAMIAGVIIFFTFLSLMYNGDILNALENRQGFQTGVSIASTAVLLFIVLFILYANSFFMRQRKKEFGMYLLYGMSERQVTLMVFYETLCLGAVSLAVGIVLGGLLSKLFGMLLMELMQYDQVVSLSFPLPAIGATIAVFLLLACVISIQSYVTVKRVQLVELFHAKEKMEKPNNPSAVLALLSVVLLGTAYTLLALGKSSPAWRDHTSASLIVCTVGIIGGTYLFFRQFAGWLLRQISRSRRYHEGNRVLWIGSLRFQMRGNTLNLTFISLFSTAIILLTCFVCINYAVQFQAVGRNLPNDIAFESRDEAANREIDRMIEESGHGVRDHRTLEVLAVEALSPLEDAFENPELYEPDVLLVAERTYNEIVDLRGHDEQVRLSGNEAVALAQGMDFPKVYAASERQTFKTAAVAGERTEPEWTLVEKKDYALLGWSTDPETSMDKKVAVLVVADEAYEHLKSAGTPGRSFELYQIGDARNAEDLSKRVHEAVAGQPGTYYSSFADVYSKQIEGSSLLLFAAAFLALIALFALASVIYFKQLKEATDAKREFAILRKIGVGDRELVSVIRKQLMFVFAPPLLLGLANSWLIIKTYILDSVADFPNLVGMVWSILGIYFLVYLFFYLSSANLYVKIAGERQV